MHSTLTARRLRIWTLVVLGAVGCAACRSQEKTEVEVEVRSIGYDSSTHAPVVVLQDQDRKLALPIWIGPAEAQAIAMQIQGINPPRPMTHDLIKTILEQTGVEMQKVVIQELKDSTYYASIWLHSGRQDLRIDSRPSDAIALAIRFHRPIFVATALLQGSTTIDLQHEAPADSLRKISGVTVQNLTDEMAEYFSLPPGKGVIVADVEDTAQAGLLRGDVILEVDGEVVSGVGDFSSKLRALKAGASVQLSVQRGSKRVPVQFTVRQG
ncbi:MAG TPA: bifunctional nuclease domain-containing protein [Candidatus Binatia bacterium]|nr:bifunctional nuclease domain-containing protein [Candidatus Binatia bacterium]